MTLGKRMKMIREDHKYNQKELADKLGVSQRTVSSWECDRNIPDMDTYKKLSLIYDCSIAYLTGTRERSAGDVTLEDILIKINTLDIDDLQMLRSKIEACIDNREQIMAIMQEKEQLEKQLKEYEEKIKMLEGNVS